MPYLEGLFIIHKDSHLKGVFHNLGIPTTFTTDKLEWCSWPQILSFWKRAFSINLKSLILVQCVIPKKQRWDAMLVNTSNFNVFGNTYLIFILMWDLQFFLYSMRCASRYMYSPVIWWIPLTFYNRETESTSIWELNNAAQLSSVCTLWNNEMMLFTLQRSGTAIQHGAI